MTHTPDHPGVYQDAAGALWTVHFEDGTSRLLIDPLIAGASAPASSSTGPLTELCPPDRQLSLEDAQLGALAFTAYADILRAVGGFDDTEQRARMIALRLGAAS